jgi:hypothetical protein
MRLKATPPLSLWIWFVAVVQSDPDFSQFGHSLFLQVAVIEGEAHEAVLTHAPIPLAAAAGAVHLLGVDTQFDEVAPPRSRSLPLFPVVEAHPSPDPFVEFQHRSIGVTDAEVVHPAGDIAA